jgi:hypothetical protein
MRGTFEQFRKRNQGKWLLIQLDEPEAESGTLRAAHEDPEVVEGEMEKHFHPEDSRERPLYLTYSVAEDQRLPSYAL